MPKLLLATPRSGATSGIEAVTRLTLAAPLPWPVVHLDTATVRRNRQRGLPTPRGLFLMASMVRDLRAMIRQHHPRAVVIQGAKNRLGFLKAAALICVAKSTHTRVVCKYGGDHFNLFYSWLSAPSQRFVSRTLNRCDAILVEAGRLRSQFANLVPEAKVRFAYLGIDNIPDRCPRRPMDRAPNLLYVGHVSKAKGAVDLLDAMPLVRDAYPQARLTMLGEHIRRERSVLHIADPHGAWRRIKVTQEYVDAPGLTVGDEKAKAFRRADLFVFPSYSEGFPVAVLEAMAQGLPMVVTPVGALPEVLDQNINCLFTEVGSPLSLAGNIIHALGNRAKRHYMGACNWMKVQGEFTLRHYAEGLQWALKDIMEG